MYELVTMRRAFDGETLSVILHKIVKCGYTPMPEVNNQCKPGLKNFEFQTIV